MVYFYGDRSAPGRPILLPACQCADRKGNIGKDDQSLSEVMNCKFDVREDFIRDLCKARLLIIDDFGMERDTSYGLETVFQIIDRRYVQRKPPILTTNLSLKTLEHPTDLEHQRIYDRVLEMTVPVAFLGNSLRPGISKDKKKQLDEILNR